MQSVGQVYAVDAAVIAVDGAYYSCLLLPSPRCLSQEIEAQGDLIGAVALKQCSWFTTRSVGPKSQVTDTA